MDVPRGSLQSQVFDLKDNLQFLSQRIDGIVHRLNNHEGAIKDTVGCQFCGAVVNQTVRVTPSRLIDEDDPKEYKVRVCTEHLKMMGVPW